MDHYLIKILRGVIVIVIGLINLKIYLDRSKDNKLGAYYRALEIRKKYGDITFSTGWCWLIIGCYGVFGGLWYLVLG
jgi:hypothetical protein